MNIYAVIALIIGIELIGWAFYSWVSEYLQKRKKKGCLKTKLLSELRASARAHVGVFRKSDGTYEVVFDKDKWFYDLSKYGKPEERGQSNYQIVETGVKTLEEARDMCDFYRRSFILQQVRERKFTNAKRYY